MLGNGFCLHWFYLLCILWLTQEFCSWLSSSVPTCRWSPLSPPPFWEVLSLHFEGCWLFLWHWQLRVLALPVLSKEVIAVVSVQSLSHVLSFANLWTAACQASLSLTIPRRLPKFMSLESVCYLAISSSVIPLSSCLQSFPPSGSFPVSWVFTSSGQSTGVSVSASVLPMSIQGWFPLWSTGLISLLSKGLSRVFSSTRHLLLRYFLVNVLVSFIHPLLQGTSKMAQVISALDPF